MNKIFSSLAIAACASLLVGCDDYSDRYSPEYASVARLEAYGEQDMTAWTINDVEEYNLKVLRSGHDISSKAEVTARIMTDNEWSAYAATYGLKRFYKIPADCFTFVDGTEPGSAKIEFAPKQFSGETIIRLFSAKINAFSRTLPPPEFEGEDFENIICLPVMIEASIGSVLPQQNTLILKIKSREASLNLTEAGFEKVSCLPTSQPVEREYTVTLSCDNPWGFSVPVVRSQEIIDAYNAANGTRYTLMSADAFEIGDGVTWTSWTDMTLEFNPGVTTQTFRLRINPDKVGMMDALALALGQPTINIKTDTETGSAIIAMQVKPSNTRIKIPADNISASSDDGVHTAKNLVDGKRNTYYTSGDAVHDGDPVYGSYVDIKLPNPIRYFAFDYISRFDFFGDGQGIPNEVHIYASNDGENWEKCGQINNMRRDFNSKSQTETYGNFDAGKEINYVRWAVVMGGASGKLDLREQNTTAHWDATALYIFGK